MTNEEKAIEIALQFAAERKQYIEQLKSPVQYDEDDIYKACLKMTEWKDQQFKELLVNKLSLVRDCYQKSKTECKKDYYSAQMVVTAEIINELFGETEQNNSNSKEILKRRKKENSVTPLTWQDI